MLLLVALLILLSWYCWRIYIPYSKFRNQVWVDWTFLHRVVIGKGPQNIPLTSFLFQKLARMCEKFETEGMCVIWLTEPTLFVYGEEAIKFFSNETTLNNKPKIYRLFDFLGENVDITRSGENWKKLRRLISSSFGTGTLKDIVPVMNYHAAALVKQLAHLKGKVTDEMDEIINVSTLRLFFEATLGIKGDTEVNEAKIKGLVKVVSELFEFAACRIIKPWMHLKIMFHFSSSARKQLQSIEELKIIVRQVLNELLETIRSRNQSIKSLADDTTTFDVPQYKLLGEDTFEEYLKDPSVTMDILRDHLTALIFGGFHTVALALIWCLWLIGLHQDVQERAYEEVMSVTVGDVQYDDARKMTYLECVIKESMRLYPIAPIFARCSNEDIHFGEHTVPKLTTVIFFPYLLHRNSKIYPDPETFNPDRFSETDANIKPRTFMPFAESVRSCLGKNYAMLEMKIILAHVLRNYRIISLDRREDVVATWEILLKNASPLLMQFVPR